MEVGKHFNYWGVKPCVAFKLYPTMTVKEPTILNIVSNGSVTTNESTSSQQGPRRLQEIQMEELQAPHINEPALDFDSRPTSSEDLFGDMEPHMRFNKNKKPALRSKL
ncbi:hypothetical protein BGX21_008223 [Mortierella sp. AD011]|nr:hypothetical protein BGX21_008223 [Mortierella sp. AD011]